MQESLVTELQEECRSKARLHSSIIHHPEPKRKQAWSILLSSQTDQENWVGHALLFTVERNKLCYVAKWILLGLAGTTLMWEWYHELVNTAEINKLQQILAILASVCLSINDDRWVWSRIIQVLLGPQYRVTLSILEQVHYHMYLCGTGFLKRISPSEITIAIEEGLKEPIEPKAKFEVPKDIITST
ncbi:hypothetical protein HanRHA438_Chr09g0395171 [Helianthus annuus]|nr:hypothetical protein HanRHA438_Chr09g0395171 [Helianthus annuus]